MIASAPEKPKPRYIVAPAEAAITTMQTAMNKAPRRMIQTADSPDSTNVYEASPRRKRSPPSRPGSLPGGGCREGWDDGVVDQILGTPKQRPPRQEQGRLQFGPRERPTDVIGHGGLVVRRLPQQDRAAPVEVGGVDPGTEPELAVDDDVRPVG